MGTREFDATLLGQNELPMVALSAVQTNRKVESGQSRVSPWVKDSTSKLRGRSCAHVPHLVPHPWIIQYFMTGS